MTDFVAKFRLEASPGNVSAVVGGARRDIESLGPAGQKAAGGLRQADTASAGLERSARGAGGAATALGAILGGIGLKEFGERIKGAAFEAQGLVTGLGAVTGGAMGAADAQAYVRGEAERMGLVIKDQTQGYLQLAASTNETALAGQKTKDIWLALNVAGTVLNQTDEKRARTLDAVAQIQAKGVVSQEELRQQLAEALPGAYQIAARAMGMTTQEFGKLVDSGKLLSEDFLPKFAGQLQKEFGPQLDKSLSEPLGRARVELAETANIGDRLTATTGTAFLTGLTSGVAALNDELGSADIAEAAEALGRDLGEGLGAAAQGAAFLVDHLDEVQTAATAVVGVGLVKWLITGAAEARTAAAAYLAKGVAAQSASAQALTAVTGEAVANNTLRGAIEAAARAEVQGAVAARDLALANEQAALATLAQARAEAASITSTLTLAEKRTVVANAERGLAAAQLATAGASARAEAAAGTLAKVTTAGGAAAQGAKALFGGLMTMLGGPWGIALAGAAAVVGSLSAALAENKRIQDDVKASSVGYAQAMRDTAEFLGPAASGVRIFSQEAIGAVTSTNDLADAVRGLTGETIRYANVKAQAASQALGAQYQDNLGKLDKLDRPGLLASFGQTLLRGLETIPNRYSGGAFDWSGDQAREQARKQLSSQNAGILGAQVAIMMDPASYEPETPELPKIAPVTNTKPDKAALKAGDRAEDLEAARLAQEAYTKALIAGGAALDVWNIKEAGRQAVERLALADRPKLTDAEKALVEQIRTRAEETERLKIANERIEKAIGLQKTAEAETKALKERSVAAVQGEAALEALQVKEAGLEALQRIGVDSLDQLTGATREHAQAAVAAAEAKEKQSIATTKAERVAASLRDLDERTSSELEYARAVAGGADALVAYQRQEFARQEIERAGKTLTAEQIAQIHEKSDALFAAKAAADSADLTQRFAEELRLSRMTNQERAIEERYLQRKSLLLAQHVDWTKEEVEARARALALADQAAAEDAAAIGDLKENLRRTFIESGHLGFEDVGDFVEQRLREAVFNALLAKPIDILINAVVGSVSGASIQGAGGGLGSLGGAQGLGSLFTSAGGLAGLTTTVTDLSAKVLGKLGISNAGGLAGGLGTAAGGAGTGALVSGLASVLGINQTSGNKIGSTIGGAIGSFIPIPGGAILGSIAGNLIGGLVGGKESNHAAVVSLDSKGQVVSTDGAKRTDQTTAAANQIAQAVASVQAALEAGGAKLNATVSKIDIGTRDSTHLNFSNGQSIDTAVGDVSAAIEAATRTILANAKWSTEAQTAYAQKLIAAGASIDQVVASLAVAGSFTGSIDDAIQQLVDPAAYAKKQALDAIDANYQALKKQAQELIDAGLATSDVLAKIDQLKDLQTDEALKRLGQAAGNAADALDPLAFKGSIQDQIAQLLDPVGFERAKALSDIESNYQALKAQAQALVDAGKLSADVLIQLDQLKGLQVADSIKKLGDAASDTAKALADKLAKQAEATDFVGSIDDAILKLTDPDAYARKSAVDGVNKNYDGLVQQAQKMIDAGLLSGDILDKLAGLRDLQIDQALSDLADSAGKATDVFADARPRLQQWLDGLTVGANSPLNPAAQRGAALETYNRLLAAARAGDADALSQITGASDALLSADRTATSSAADRLALFNQVQSDIKGLTALNGAAVVQSPEVAQLAKVSKGIDQLVNFSDPEQLAIRAPAPIEVKLSPWLQTTLQDQGAAQTAVMKDLLEKVADSVDRMGNSLSTQVGGLTVELRDGLAGLKGQLGNVGALTAAVNEMSGDISDLAAETRTLIATVRASTVSR